MISIKNLRNGHAVNPWDVKVDRSNKVLGNNFYMSNESQRDIVCDKYDAWLCDNIRNTAIRNELNRLWLLHRTYGKLNLWCWCAPKRCHAESIRNILNNVL